MLVVVVHHRSSPTSTVRIDQPRHLCLYVASTCFKHFKHFRGILQLFHMDVAKVGQDVCARGMLRLFKMFHLFKTYVASILI
jgi:hypothetical protein